MYVRSILKRDDEMLYLDCVSGLSRFTETHLLLCISNILKIPTNIQKVVIINNA